MRNLSIAAIALVAFATPALARDGALYVGIEGGIWLPRDTNYRVNSTRVQTVPIGQGLLGQTVTTSFATFGSGFVSDYKRGYDVDAIVGYDFGFLRLEGELAYKRAKLRDLTGSSTLVSGINTAPISGATPGSFNFGNRTSVASAMANALLDVGIAPGFSIYGGGGYGQARVKTLGGRDTVYAGQLIGGLSTAISENVDLGIKYRYFQTRKVNFNTSSSFTGTGGSTSVSNFANQGRIRSHSVLASLIFNFGGRSDAPPPPPPPPVEVAPVVQAPPPPATQTCPDGTVVLATDVCPAPPPPPPPPPATEERG